LTSTSGRGKWRLHIIGKAAPEGERPIRDALMMPDFARYEAFHGLPLVPTGHECSPSMTRDI
jgi:integrase/recombinase XerC